MVTHPHNQIFLLTLINTDKDSILITHPHNQILFLLFLFTVTGCVLRSCSVAVLRFSANSSLWLNSILSLLKDTFHCGAITSSVAHFQSWACEGPTSFILQLLSFASIIHRPSSVICLLSFTYSLLLTPYSMMFSSIVPALRFLSVHYVSIAKTFFLTIVK